MSNDLERYVPLIRQNVAEHCASMFREPNELLPYPFLVPGSVYAHVLWDWDSWLCSVAILQALEEPGIELTRERTLTHMQGCVLNFLHHQDASGYIPICIDNGLYPQIEQVRRTQGEINQAKPVLAQMAALTTRELGSATWIREGFAGLQRFHQHYDDEYRDDRTGLYYWKTDLAIGVDNDPATFGRPRNSSATVYMNTLMVRELEAAAYLAGQLGQPEIQLAYRAKRDALVAAIQEYLWDERDGFYYSADLMCKIDPVVPGLHRNQTVFWPCLPVRIQMWTGLMPLWAGIATPAQAERLVREHLLNPRTFNALGGIRSLSAAEPMYNLEATGNPSNWLGGIWLIVNYMAFRGLLQYGYTQEARELCWKTVALLGRDVAEHGAMHEYYVPETGAPIINKGFMNWNYLVMNMMAEVLGDRPVVREWMPDDAPGTRRERTGGA